MADERTTEFSLFEGHPVRSIRAEVVGGPDLGSIAPVSGERVSVGTASDNLLVLGDKTVSRYHCELSCRGDEIVVVDHGSMNGTLAGSARLERGSIRPGTVLQVGKTSLRVDHGEQVMVDLHQTNAFGGLRGTSPAMRRLMALAARTAATATPVLVVGESGTGKEVFARALHEQGPRASQPFVAVDCGALSANLVASELFGHERGAFTGADAQHPGAFERAGRGTLFLDEIGELPRELQPTLLGVLERRRFRRLGGKVDLPAEARVVAATNRDLRAEVNAGTFRLDLYFRLAVLRVELPPLRENPSDIPVLVEHFLRESGDGRTVNELFPGETMKALMEHRWPGNARQLRNFVEASLAMGEVAALDDFAAEPGSRDALFDGAPADLFERPYTEARQAIVVPFERRYLTRLLERSGGNVAKAARTAKMNRSYLIELLARHGLKGSEK